MPVRIPLVPAAPSDGKQYVQKDGQWVVTPAASTTDDGLLSKEDKALLNDVRDGKVAGGATDLWISEIADSNIVTDKNGSAITGTDGQPLIFGDFGVSSDRFKGVDLTWEPSAKTFSTYVWASVDATTKINPRHLPFRFNSMSDARIAASWMLRELILLTKNMENDTNFDLLVSQYTSNTIEPKIKGGPPSNTFTSSDMDNRTFAFNSTTDVNTAKSEVISEWFEVIVGSTADGTGYYTFWFVPFMLYDSATNSSSNYYPNRLIYQTSYNDNFESKNKIRYYANGTAPALPADERNASSMPQSGVVGLTLRSAGSNLSVAGNAPSPLWLEPLTIQMNR